MDIENAIPLSRFQFGKLTISYFAEGILHVYIHPDVSLEMDDLRKVIEHISALGPEKFLNLFEFDQYASIDNKVREWASDPEGNKRTIADAIVIKGLDQKLLADFYLKFNKPVKPTQVFNNLDHAIDWLLSIKAGKGQ